ncbi:MAG TPA: iron ABC transporter permease [Solirubrobacteraceae bacterium]
MAAAAPAAPRRGGLAFPIVGVFLALLVAGPLLALPASFIGEGEALDSIAASLLPEALRNSAVLAAGVGAGTLCLGGLLAALVTFYDFPGRRWLEWALVLPMAMPAYVLVFVLLGQYDADSAVQDVVHTLFGDGATLPEIRSTAGTIIVLTACLYPYVYVMGRTAFEAQTRETLEAARTLGLSHARAIRRVALPLARPALAAGTALAVMEALADFGAVNLLGYRAMTDAIYRVWYGAFDRSAALQLATVLVCFAAGLVILERYLRSRARYQQALVRGEAMTPRRLRGWRGLAAAVLPVTVVALVVVAPLVQLVLWSGSWLAEGSSLEALTRAALNSVMLASLAAVLAAAAATVIAYGHRARVGSRAGSDRIGAAAARAATLGYAVPGTVVAVAVYGPLSWLEKQVDGVADVGLFLTGSVVGLLLAYLVRFQALALFSVEARLGAIGPELDEAARGLGADRARVFADVHFPLLWPGIVTAALLVFVETLKELPATALLRPLGGDTLAITVWEATKDSRFDTAALPALLIVLIGLIPIALLLRRGRSLML